MLEMYRVIWHVVMYGVILLVVVGDIHVWGYMACWGCIGLYGMLEM